MIRLTGDIQRIVNATPAFIGPQELIRLSFGAVFALSVQPEIAGVAAGAMILIGLAIAAQMQVMGNGFARMAGDEMRLYGLLRGHPSISSRVWPRSSLLQARVWCGTTVFLPPPPDCGRRSSRPHCLTMHGPSRWATTDPVRAGVGSGNVTN